MSIESSHQPNHHHHKDDRCKSKSSGHHSPSHHMNLTIISLPLLLLFAFATNCAIVPSASVMDTRSLASAVPVTDPLAPSFLTSLITRMLEALDFKKVFDDLKEGRSTPATCNACKFGFGMLQQLSNMGKGKEEIASLSYSICTTLRIESATVCRGIVDVFKEELVAVMTQLVLSPSEVCGVLLGESCSSVSNPLHNWSVPLTPFPKPSKPPPSPPSNSNSSVIKILHLSDTHIDPWYAVGANTKCGEPLCCRELPTSAKPPVHLKAGFWGDYRGDCDIPMRTYESMLKFISTHHKDIDYVIWTGDIPAHDVWNQTKAGQVSIIKSVSQLMDKYLGNTPILPALGNHESVPVNSFPVSGMPGHPSISWLYDELYNIWSKWLPEYSLTNIKKGAYYSAYLKDKFKLISLNMNYCNNQNWWLLLNSTDPADELSWLVRELQSSELLGEKVAIIGHIPPGANDCLQVWSSNYYRIINRFEYTVVGQFFGHTHQDEFELFYDTSSNNDTGHNAQAPFSSLRATSVAYIAPSTTTFGGVNPGYRIYTLRGDTFQLLDHETYFVNLTNANERPEEELTFSLSYTARKDLKMSTLDPSSWHELILKMIRDPNLFFRFEQFLSNRADHVKHCKLRDILCKADILCRLITGKAHDYSLCQSLLNDKEWSKLPATWPTNRRSNTSRGRARNG